MIFSGKYTILKGSNRPHIVIAVRAVSGAWISLPFLIDSGADVTVLDHSCIRQFGIDSSVGTVKTEVSGVGGNTPYIEFSTQLRFRSETDESKVFAGTIGVFTDPAACDTPVLGRDVLDAFKVIFDRDRDQVLLLSPPHDYIVVTP